MENTTESKGTKFIGGEIPIELFWEFKKAQAIRKESAKDALENAIRLYLDLPTEVQNNE